MATDFKHLHAAHCESGVTTKLLNHNGITEISEAMVFGISSGISYFHLPLLKVSGGPAIIFRTKSGAIFNRTFKALGVQYDKRKFTDKRKAQNQLDDLLAKGIPVGCQVGMNNLTYFGVEKRFHFNAHHLIVYDKIDKYYQISDPICENTTQLSEKELSTVRFAEGIFAPKGFMYYPLNVAPPPNELLANCIKKGIKKSVFYMLFAPGNFIGVKGIKYTSNQIEKWREQLGPRKAGQYLKHIINMQEDIGTGGGGFRYLYADFLEQAFEITKNKRLYQSAKLFTELGDMWRNSALIMAGICKGKTTELKDFKYSASQLKDISKKEHEAFHFLKTAFK